MSLKPPAARTPIAAIALAQTAIIHRSLFDALPDSAFIRDLPTADDARQFLAQIGGQP